MTYPSPRRPGRAALALTFPLLLLLTAARLDAQVVGANVSGTITDESGGALPGVTVTTRNKATGAQQTLVTESNGNYRVVALQPGPYEISAELAGFATVKRELVLTIGADVAVNFKMGVAALEEGGIRTTFIKAVERATLRSRELGRGPA